MQELRCPQPINKQPVRKEYKTPSDWLSAAQNELEVRHDYQQASEKFYMAGLLIVKYTIFLGFGQSR
jgi:hypothetical protein